jgi:hypothetical protein
MQLFEVLHPSGGHASPLSSDLLRIVHRFFVILHELIASDVMLRLRHPLAQTQRIVVILILILKILPCIHILIFLLPLIILTFTFDYGEPLLNRIFSSC